MKKISKRKFVCGTRCQEISKVEGKVCSGRAMGVSILTNRTGGGGGGREGKRERERERDKDGWGKEEEEEEEDKDVRVGLLDTHIIPLVTLVGRW